MPIVAFVISMVLFVGSFVLMGYSFDVEFHGLMFAAGIAAVVLSLVIPFHILKRLDR